MSTTIIIVIAVIAIAILLVLRARQNKAPETKKTSTASAKKVSAKKAKPAEEKPAETKPKVDIGNVLSQIDVLIADKEYAKAEGIINQALNKDASLHELYPRLLTLYQLQDDDFAIKQLLETVQNLNLNEVYQQLYNDHEVYKAEQEKIKQLEQKKNPEVFEYTPTTLAGNTAEVAARPETIHQEQNNTLAFDQISFDAPATPDETQAQQETTEHVLDFNLSASTETTATDSPAISNDEHTPTLEFKLEEPAATDTPATVEPLEFKLDTTSPAEITDAPSLEFNLSPEPSSEASTGLTFDLSTATVEEAATVIPETIVEDQPTEIASTFADVDDPIVQAFPVLQGTDPAELDIELAEQYIRFGEYKAAKSILKLDQSQLSEKQAAKVNQLLQKIAS